MPDKSTIAFPSIFTLYPVDIYGLNMAWNHRWSFNFSSPCISMLLSSQTAKTMLVSQSERNINSPFILLFHVPRFNQSSLVPLCPRSLVSHTDWWSEGGREETSELLAAFMTDPDEKWEYFSSFTHSSVIFPINILRKWSGFLQKWHLETNNWNLEEHWQQTWKFWV